MNQGIHLLNPQQDPVHNSTDVPYFDPEIRNDSKIKLHPDVKYRVELCNFLHKNGFRVFLKDQYICAKSQNALIHFHFNNEKWIILVANTKMIYLNLSMKTNTICFTRYHQNLLKDQKLLAYLSYF